LPRGGGPKNSQHRQKGGVIPMVSFERGEPQGKEYGGFVGGGRGGSFGFITWSELKGKGGGQGGERRITILELKGVICSLL